MGYNAPWERDDKGDAGERKACPVMQPSVALRGDVVWKKRKSNFFAYYMKGKKR